MTIPFRVMQYDFDGKYAVKTDSTPLHALILTSVCRAAYDTEQQAQQDANLCTYILTIITKMQDRITIIDNTSLQQHISDLEEERDTLPFPSDEHMGIAGKIAAIKTAIQGNKL